MKIRASALEILNQGEMKNDQFNSYQEHERKKRQERDILGRTRTEPKINQIIVKFNGDQTGFELFVNSLLSDYLHSGDIDKSQQSSFVNKVEIYKTNEKELDF